MFELTVCRKAASRHQKQAAADDRKATHTQKQPYSGDTGSPPISNFSTDRKESSFFAAVVKMT